ncbi:MAG: hypothetical protein ABJB61_10570 [bacterium]
MKGVLTCALCALLLAVILLAAGLIDESPGIGGALFMVVGLPGYMAAANSTLQVFGPDKINSEQALFYFGLTYVVVNAAIFMLVFIAGWQLLAALQRLIKHRRRIQ